MPGDALAKNMKISFHETYDEEAADYESHVGSWMRSSRALFGSSSEGQVPPEFPEFLSWVGREFVEGAALRSLYADAWWAKRRDERNIELQQVSVRRAGKPDPVSVDHTFATLKNVHQPAELKEKVAAQLDMVNNATGEVITAVCVTDTSVYESAHALNSLELYRGETYGTVFTDTWPSEEASLRHLLSMVDGRLDVLHWMKRFTRLLLEVHELYAQALFELSRAIYH